MGGFKLKPTTSCLEVTLSWAPWHEGDPGASCFLLMPRGRMWLWHVAGAASGQLGRVLEWGVPGRGRHAWLWKVCQCCLSLDAGNERVHVLLFPGQMGATSEDMTVGVTPEAGGQIRELSSEGAPSSRPLGHAAWGARVLAPGTAWLLEGKEPPPPASVLAAALPV